jgi:hypothetical protein
MILFFLHLLAYASAQPSLDQVNHYRKLHQAGPVVWDNTLASQSSKWAENLAGGNKLIHSTPNGTYGENLATTYDTEDPIGDAVDMWYKEVSYYDYTKPQFSTTTGHFTQLVWNSTRRIGAGYARNSRGMQFVVMRFVPPGNYENQYTKNVFPKVAIEGPSPRAPNPRAAPAYKAPPPAIPMNASLLTQTITVLLTCIAVGIFLNCC